MIEQNQQQQSQGPINVSPISPVSLENNDHGHKSTITAIVVVLVVLALGYIGFKVYSGYKEGRVLEPVQQQEVPLGLTELGLPDISSDDDSAATINRELESLNIGDLDTEFEEIDQELRNL